MRRAIIGASLAAVILPLTAYAANVTETGRYQALLLHAGPGGETVLLLDTKEGYVWHYWSSPALAGNPASQGVAYITKLRPGTKIGDIIDRQIFP
jgi:hypothetical protein